MPTPRKQTRSNVAKDVNSAPLQDEYGHLQPQDLKLEEAVLGALLVEKNAYYQIADILKPESFYEKKHQVIFEAIRRLYIEEKPLDILTVTEELRRVGKLESAGGPFYITQLSGGVTSSAHIEYHARIIAQKALARDLITFTSKIQTKAFDATTDVDELMQEAEGELFELSRSNMKQDFVQIDPILKEAVENLRKAAARPDGMSGIASLFTDLDRITAGWQKSDLIIVAARPAMGKTAFALTIAKNIAIDQNIPVAFFSLEMSKLQLVNRILVNVCEIPGDKIRTGRLESYEWMQLDKKQKLLTGAPLYIDDTPSLSVFELRTKARRLVQEHGVQLIMIDYLQLMNASGMQFNSRQEEVSTISRSLKGLAKELNIPIIALSQLNRGVESREKEGKRPQLSDLRESGAIEQDADMVILLHRPEYYKIYVDAQNRDMRGRAEILIAKHRNGSVGDVILTFKGQYARFQNVSDDNPTPLPGEELNMAQPKYMSQKDAPPTTASLPAPNAFEEDSSPAPF